MKRLAQALLGLSKAIIARPKESTKAPTQIHWTKSDKPLEEMAPQERKIFGEKMATESLKALGSKPPTNGKKGLLKKSSLIIILLSLLIVLLVYFNWSKVPKFGTNAKALTYVKLSCINGETLTLEKRSIAAEKALNLDPSWERLANAYRDLFSSSEILKQMAAKGQDGSAEYATQYSTFQSALVTINGICNGVNLK
jgi:hypothetical protein